MNSPFTVGPRGLMIDEQTIGDIHAIAGSPSFYVYHADTIRQQYKKLRDALPEQIDILYAIKPNPNLSIIKVLQNEGAGFEAASLGDLMIAEHLGFDPSMIAFAGPAKPYEALEKAVDMRIGALHIESLTELRHVNEIARARDVVMPVGLRINTDFQFHGTDINMSGEPSKFGIDEDQMEDVIAAGLKMENITLAGIHVYSATGVMDAEQYMENVRYTLGVAARANEHFDVTWIDYGGGYGVDYTGETEFDVSTLKQQMDDALSEHDFITKNNVRIMTEPGRYLVANSGMYVTRIIDDKVSRGTNFLLVSGGVHQFIRESWVDVSHPIVNLSRAQDDGKIFDIGGELCTPTDYLGRDITLPSKTHVGDYIGVLLAGAYGLTMSPMEFLSNQTPAELLIDSEQVYRIRESKRAEDSFSEQPIPEEL